MSEYTKGKLELSSEYGENCIIVDSKGNEIFDACPIDSETDENKRNNNQFWASGKITKANAKELVRRYNAFEEDGIVSELVVACKIGLDAMEGLKKISERIGTTKDIIQHKELVELVEFVENALANAKPE